MLLLLLALTIATEEATEPTGVARIRADAEALAPDVTTGLGKAYLEAAKRLPAVEPRVLFFDSTRREYLTEETSANLEGAEREKLKKLNVDETLYYNTRYGSPLAYSRPMELLGRTGVESLASKKVVDFGCGGLGPLRLMAAGGAHTVGVDVDPMLGALYSAPGDQGEFLGGRVALVLGRYPADPEVRGKVGGSIDLFLSKNTLKRGYVHPEQGRAAIDLGMEDAAFLKILYENLKPGGSILIYNLGPAPAGPGEPYRAMADIRTPFAREAWEAAGFRVEAFDADDAAAARTMGAKLGWDQGPGKMDLAKDLFATYTIVRRP